MTSVVSCCLQVIAAEGEQKSSRALKEASDIISESSSALQLRYLQTLNTISAEKNSTIIFPLPMEVLQYFIRQGDPPSSPVDDGRLKPSAAAAAAGGPGPTGCLKNDPTQRTGCPKNDPTQNTGCPKNDPTQKTGCPKNDPTQNSVFVA